MLSVLDLFSRDHTTMTAEQIAESLALTRTTCYRYTRELTQAGLLVSHGGRFMLGPRIIELDHRMIESDPLINAGGPVVSALADSVGATGLLTAGYADHVVNVFAHAASQRPLPMSFGRGTTMPMFRSSTSKVLLAGLTRGRLRRVWDRHAHDADCQAIGTDWKGFWRALQEIQQQGYAENFVQAVFDVVRLARLQRPAPACPGPFAVVQPTRTERGRIDRHQRSHLPGKGHGRMDHEHAGRTGRRAEADQSRHQQCRPPGG